MVECWSSQAPINIDQVYPDYQLYHVHIPRVLRYSSQVHTAPHKSSNLSSVLVISSASPIELQKCISSAALSGNDRLVRLASFWMSFTHTWTPAFRTTHTNISSRHNPKTRRHRERVNVESEAFNGATIRMHAVLSPRVNINISHRRAEGQGIVGAPLSQARYTTATPLERCARRKAGSRMLQSSSGHPAKL